jgi:hypothetical protein
MTSPDTPQPTEADRELCGLIEVMDQITEPRHRTAWLLGNIARHAQQAYSEGYRQAKEDTAEMAQQAREEEREINRKIVDAIRKEAATANEVIRLNRDGGGSGRVKVATAMHRIERLANLPPRNLSLKDQDDAKTD